MAKMTNGEKYLKEGIKKSEFTDEIVTLYANWNDVKDEYISFRSYITEWLNEPIKPTLTEDERVILRNISEEYVKVGKNNEGLYFLSYRNCEPNECCSYYANVFKSSLFSFIQEGDEYSIEELLKGE